MVLIVSELVCNLHIFPQQTYSYTSWACLPKADGEWVLLQEKNSPLFILLPFPIGPRGYKTFLMHNSVEHELLNAHKYKKYQEIRLF